MFTTLRNAWKIPELRRKIMDAIFSDDAVLKVKMCSNYIIDLRGTCDATAGYRYGDEFIGYIPNPHIHRFACLGNYKPYINRAIRDGNLIGAIEQCVTSAKSLNFTEAHTVRYFLNDLFTSRYKVIVLPDGKEVTPVEALEYLKTLEGSKTEDQEVENV